MNPLIRKLRDKDILGILLIAAPVRLFFYLHLHVSVFADTPTYLFAKANIFKGQIDPLRPPVYPWLLKTIALLSPGASFGGASAASSAASFAASSGDPFAALSAAPFLHTVAIVQACISFISILFFYKIARFFLKTRALVWASTLLYAVSPTLINFDFGVVPESLSISAMVFFIWLISDYIKRPSGKKAFYYTLVIFGLLMIKPVFIYLYAVMGLFWLARGYCSRDGFPLASRGLISLGLCFLLLLGYRQLNKAVNGVSAVSSVSSYNQLEVVANYGLYPLGGDSLLTAIIRHDVKDTANFFLAVLQNSVRAHNIRPDRIDRYVRNSIAAAPALFLQKTARRFYAMQSEKVAVIYARESNPNSGLANTLMHLNPFPFLSVTLLLLADAVLQIRSRTIHWLHAFCWALVAFQYGSVFLGAVWDHQRLFVMAIPPIILMVSAWLDRAAARLSHRL